MTPANAIAASLNTAVADTMAAGSYECAITVTAGGAANSSLTIPVRLTVNALTLSVSPNTLTLNYPTPGPGNPPITVTSSSGNVTVTRSLGAGCDWLSVTPASGRTPISVGASINTAVAATLPAGSHHCTVTFSVPGTAATASLTATLVVGTPPPPSIQGTVQGCRVSGTVAVVSSPQDYRVVIYARTNAYCIQPCDFEPTTTISSSGAWGPVDSHNGDIFALLVRAGYSPPTLTDSLPAVDRVNVLAATGRVGAVAGCDVAKCPAR